MKENSIARKLTGAEKAAVILLSVSEENSTKIFSMMSEDEIREVSAAMSSLGPVSPEVVERLINEFTQEINNISGFVGNLETTGKLLEKVLDKDKAKLMLDEIGGPAGKNTWDKLGNVNEEILASYLKNEYPQTVALIMSKLTPSHAAKVLSALPEDFSLEVMLRVLSLEPVKKEVLDRVENILRAEFISSLTKAQKSDANEIMAEIFNNFDRNNEAKFMQLLEKQAPTHAEQIKGLMFTFDDLVHINPSDIQTLLRSVDKTKLVIALKGASEAVRNLFVSNMSQRAAKILLEDMQGLGPIRVKDVDEAQGTIITLARDMAAKGEITISREDKDDEFI